MVICALLASALGCVGCGATLRPSAEAMRTAAVPFPTSEWDALLKRYVDDQGRVGYAAIDRASLDRVFAGVAASSPDSRPDLYPTREAKLPTSAQVEYIQYDWRLNDRNLRR